MFTTVKMGLNQALQYYTDRDGNTQKVGYYTSHKGEKDGNNLIAPRFCGGLARELGMEPGTFDVEKFHAGLRGNFETDLKFVQDTNSPVAAHDFVFSAPKDLSIMALAAGDERLMHLHVNAVDKAMKLIESLAQTRITENGVTRKETAVGGLAWTEYLHTTSRRRESKNSFQKDVGRALGHDMNLHTHCVTNPLVKCADGKLRRLENNEIMLAQHLADAVYKQAICDGYRELGLEFVMTKNGPQLTCVSQQLIDHFSGGRTVMKEFLAAQGIDIENASSAQKEWANLSTRLRKDHDFDHENAQQWWKDRAEYMGLKIPEIPIITEVQLQKIKKEAEKERSAALSPEKIVDIILRSKTETSASIRSKHVIIEQSIKLSHYKYSSADFDSVIKKKIASGNIIIRNDGKSLTTKEVLDVERSIPKLYRDALNRGLSIATIEQVEKGILEKEKDFFNHETGVQGHLSKGQRDLVMNALLSKDNLLINRGDAGTGKSTAAEIIHSVAKLCGYKCYALAPTGQAVDSIAEAGPESMTGQRANIDENFWKKIDSKSVIIMDEGGLFDARLGSELLKRAQKAGAKVVVLGDAGQHPSVGMGMFMQQLEDEAKQHNRLVTLTDMQRHRTDFIRDIHFASRDDQAKAFKLLHEEGCLAIGSTQNKRSEIIAKRYCKMTPEEQAISLVITGKNVDRININNTIRSHLNLPAGFVTNSFEVKNLDLADRMNVAEYEVGDMIRFMKNSTGTVRTTFSDDKFKEVKSGSFEKGDVHTVVEKKGHLLILKRDDGSTIEFNPINHASEITVATKENLEISKGELIRFTTAMKLGNNKISTGDRARVLDVDLEKGLAKVFLLKSEKETIVDLNGSGRPIRHAYCQTSMSSQGATGKGDVILNVPKDDETISKNAWYVNLTRSTKKIFVVTDAKSATDIAKLIAKSSQKIIKAMALHTPKREPVEVPPAFWEKNGWKNVPVRENNQTKIFNFETIKIKLIEAKEKFGEILHVAGSEKWKDKVAMVVAKSGLNIGFIEKAMSERLLVARQDIAKETAVRQSATGVQAMKPGNTMDEKFAPKPMNRKENKDSDKNIELVTKPLAEMEQKLKTATQAIAAKKIRTKKANDGVSNKSDFPQTITSSVNGGPASEKNQKKIAEKQNNDAQIKKNIEQQKEALKEKAQKM